MAMSAALLVQAIYFSIVYAKSRKKSKGRRRNEATFGALITTMRKCFKCDRSQKRRRRLLSGNAVKGSQHFALSAYSFSLYFSLYLALSLSLCNGVAILCLELQWGTARESLLRAAASSDVDARENA